MKKRGQITVFVLLGLVILIIFGIVFFVSKSSSDLVLEKRINKIYGDFLRQNSIESFIQACIEQATKAGVLMIAKQGGRLHAYGAPDLTIDQIDTNKLPPGYPPNAVLDTLPLVQGSDTLYIGYGIKSPGPKYPDGTTLAANSDNTFLTANKRLFVKRERSLSNPFSLPAACNFEGPNYWDQSIASFSCETRSKKNDSLQEYLRIFIQDRTEKCAKIDTFNQGQFSIKPGEINSQVALGNTDISVSVRYPLEVSVGNQPPATKFLDFAYRPPIRLKKVFELATHLIGHFGPRSVTHPPKADGNDINFDMTQEDPNDCFDEFNGFEQPCIADAKMKITRTQNYCLDPDAQNVAACITHATTPHQKHADLVNITDSSFLINGQPLVFSFAIENRPPVLGHIDDQTIRLGQEHTFTLRARDPDDEPLAYALLNEDGNAPYSDPHSFEGTDGNKQLTIESASPRKLTLEVKDSEGLSDSQVFELKI